MKIQETEGADADSRDMLVPGATPGRQPCAPWESRHGQEPHRVTPPAPANREPQSISVLLPDVLLGNREAIGRLWQRFFPRLVALANSRLGPNLRLPVDGEDVATNAFMDFVRLLQQPDRAERFPRLENRDHLWRILARITVWEALDWVRPPAWPAEAGDAALDQVPGREPEPQFADAINEEVEYLIGRLHGRDAEQTDRLRRLARIKMQGRTNKDAARELNCSVAQVELLLAYIRQSWSEYDPRPRARETPGGE
jgi:DNA-directed RNA polymerase specialized sigma24 family protein